MRWPACRPVYSRFTARVLSIWKLCRPITDDHALQERVWDGLADWQRDNPRSIREALTESDVPSHDRRVRIVGLEAYEAAGGAVRRDLFEHEDGGFVQDVALLETLVRQKLESIAEALKEEGWNWTETAFLRLG